MTSHSYIYSAYKCSPLNLIRPNPKVSNLRKILREDGFKRLFFRHPASEVYQDRNGTKATIKIGPSHEWKDQRESEPHNYKTIELKMEIDKDFAEKFERNLRSFY